MILTVLIILSLFLICYQDFTSRLITWYYFPISIILIISRFFFTDQEVKHHSLFVNFGLVLILLVLTSLFYSIKNKKFTFIIDKLIGTADILMFLIVCLVFSSFNLIVFLLISFLISIIYQLISIPFSRNYKQIPLAGVIGALLMICFILQDAFNLFKMSDDLVLFAILDQFLME